MDKGLLALIALGTILILAFVIPVRVLVIDSEEDE